MFRLVLAIVAIALSIYSGMNTTKKHKRINAKGVAYLNKAENLGSHMYALYYDVDSKDEDKPFQILITPVKKIPKKKKELIYFEKGNGKENFYFDKFYGIDPRYKTSIILGLLFVLLLVTSITNR